MSEKQCIFCQERPSNMTDEHVWGDWVTSHVPRTMNKHTHANVFMPRPGEPDPADLRVRAGDPLSSQVKVVCEKCNSGWLSGIQNSAKPFLLPLFEGAAHQIDVEAQKKIAAWITMATMTGEYLSREPRRVAVSQVDRTWFMDHSEPLPNWSVWIGRHRWHRAVPQSSHLSLHVLDTDTLPDQLTDEPARPNTQTTAFSIGELFAFAMSSEFPEIPPGWDWRTATSARINLRRIWPIEKAAIRWPPPAMTDQHATAYPVAFAHYMDDLARKVGYQVSNRAQF
jgi:hypothetical protein